MAKEEYVDGSAYGKAPMGPQPQGQKAGENWPGNTREQIDRSFPNPAMPDKRMDALYSTIESRDHMKSRAGERMMFELENRGRNVNTMAPQMREKSLSPIGGAMSPGDYS